jgi:hypothetical protein
MDPEKSFETFENEFDTYGKLIQDQSRLGIKILNNIMSKKDAFNKLTDDQRIQYMNSDPDFIALEKTLKNLKIYYASFFDFVNKSMNESPSVQN